MKEATARNGQLLTLGAAWTHSYGGYVELHSSGGTSPYTAYVVRPDRKVYYFNSSTLQGPWIPDGDTADTLVQIVQGTSLKWKLVIAETHTTEIYDVQTGRLESVSNRAGLTQMLQYDSDGRLARVSDAFGRSLGVTYDAAHRISSVADPEGNLIAYAYENNTNSANLISVTYPVAQTKTYQYAPGQPMLTAITDENGHPFATWTYDSNAKVVSSQHAGDAGKITLAYPDESQTSVTDSVDSVQSATRTYNFSVLWGVKLLKL